MTKTPAGAGRRVTPLRLGAAFAVVLSLFAIALVVTMISLDRIAAAENEVRELDHAKHDAHRAAALVREQYIHQAHTLINWDSSHMEHYEQAAHAAAEATRRLMQVARTDRERAIAAEIARLAERSDAEFRVNIVGAIERDDRVAGRDLAGKAEHIASRVVELNDELTARFEARATAAQARAAATRRTTRTVTGVLFASAIAVAAIIGTLLLRSIARQEEERVRRDRLASIGQVAAGVAHEINNPLGVILGYAKVLGKDPAAPGREELAIIEDEARQCQRIVQGLLDLARPPRLDLGAVDLAAMARDATERLEESGQLGELTVAGPAEDTQAMARADEAKIRQVVWNVVLNAAQAAAGGDRKSIAIEAARADGQAVLTVSDSGPGMAPDVLQRVFDPFFTTKKDGTGLGLAIAQAIVDAHGGRIEIDSQPGRGTTVRLRLPAAAETRG